MYYRQDLIELGMVIIMIIGLVQLCLWVVKAFYFCFYSVVHFFSTILPEPEGITRIKLLMEEKESPSVNQEFNTRV